MHDPIDDSLRSLRSLHWERPDHQQLLEARLMQQHSSPRGPIARLFARAPLAAAFLLLATGVALASGVAAFTNWIVTATPVSDTETHFLIQDEKGNVVVDEVLPSDTGFFALEDDADGTPGMLIGVRPLESAPGVPEAFPAPKAPKRQKK